MNDLNEKEFRQRTEAILRAQKIFVDSGVTRNITVAFFLYREMLADDRQMPLHMTQSQLNNGKTWIPYRARKKCPECGATLHLRAVGLPKCDRLNKHGYQSCWECLGCGYELYSTATVAEQVTLPCAGK